MPRPGYTNLIRSAILALAMFVWFAVPMGVGTAQAAGCHLPDRPVLGLSLDQRTERHEPVWALLGRGRAAPPVLTRVPCSAEIPGTTVIVMSLVSADGVPASLDDPIAGSWRILSFDDLGGRDPDPGRLDRPPR